MKRKCPTLTAPTPESIKTFVEETSIQKDKRLKCVKEGKVTLIQQTREYELITPLFGGGTETQKADPVSVIRVPSIRGQIRFWWRAIRGGQFGGIMKRMKQREDEIFGAASAGNKASPSQVQIDLTIKSSGNDLSLVTDHRGREVHISDMKSPYGYAAFPLRDKALSVRRGIGFSLTLIYPTSISPEVEAAVWAWEMFGGIGGRTRRGFGAVQPSAYRPSAGDVKKDIDDGFTKHFAGNSFPSNVPHLSNGPTSIKITSPITSPQNSVPEVLKYLIGELRDFRQDRPGNSTNGTPGRSLWHEPDAIRELFKPRVPAHTPSPTSVRKFPRAAFGLPIVFKFKQQDERAGDPPKTTLEGADKDKKRMASPLILRPLACANNQAVGLAVILSGTSLPPSGIILNGAPGNPTVQANLTPTEASAIKPLGGNADVLQVFLAKLT